MVNLSERECKCVQNIYRTFFKAYFQPHELTIALLSKELEKKVQIGLTSNTEVFFYVLLFCHFFYCFCAHFSTILSAYIKTVVESKLSVVFRSTLWLCPLHTYVYQFLSTVTAHQTHFIAITHTNVAKSKAVFINLCGKLFRMHENSQSSENRDDRNWWKKKLGGQRRKRKT